MTFSILARDPATGEMGCAAATGNLAVGAWVLRAQAGVGLVATQGFSVSSLWGDQCMSAMARGESAARIVDRIVSDDAGAGLRQLTVLDANGGTAGWTGDANTDIKAHYLETDLAIAGNWLSDADVLAVLRDAYLNTDGVMAERLLRALSTAAKAGGDSRGTLSAATKVVSPSHPPLDLRVDYSRTPIEDLASLYEMTLEGEYHAFLSRLPTLENPERC